MTARKIISVSVAVAYGFMAAVAPALADNEFDGGSGRSDGAWGWKPPSHDRFGSSDGIGGGGSYEGLDDYGSGNGGPFGGRGGGRMAGQMGLLALLISLISGRNGMVGAQRDRAGYGMMNLMMADSSGSSSGGSSGGSSNGSQEDAPDIGGRITVPDDNFEDAP